MDFESYILGRKTAGGGGGSATWGGIGGTLSDQTDLQAALNTKADADEYIPIVNNAGFHNNIYRGKYLGTSVTPEQYAAIDAGTFDDLYIGDYWTINSVNWRIAAFDYWLNTGDTDHVCTTHHVVIVPDSAIASGSMNSTSTIVGAYVGSNYYTGNNGNTAKATAQSVIEGAFGAAHILTHYDRFANAVTNDYETGGAWFESTFDLMNEIMVYGCTVFHNLGHGTSHADFFMVDKTQLPLFRHNCLMITIQSGWWLRDVARGTNFCNVGASGYTSASNASTSMDIRPVFALYAGTTT